jgi:hypothetical protein
MKSGLFLITPIIVGVISFLYIFQFANRNITETNFEEVAFGEETVSYRAKFQGAPVHCDGIVNAESCIDGWEARGRKPLVVWLGNSQIHAINQIKKNDVNCVQILYGMLSEVDYDLLAFSDPNANLQEHYVLFEYLTHHLPIKTLLLPVVFDDMRENGLRDSFVPILEDSEMVYELSKSEIGQSMLVENRSANSDNDLAGLNDTPQIVVEDFIVNWLSENWSLWKERPIMRGELLYRYLYRFRNWIFDISAQSKRKMISGYYAKNKSALKEILQASEKYNVQVVMYIPPLRNDTDIPYVAEEYISFKKDIQSLGHEYGVVFKNLEELVPGELWGTKEGTSFNGKDELDFMHFQAGGHRLLGEEMFYTLRHNNFIGVKQ